MADNFFFQNLISSFVRSSEICSRFHQFFCWFSVLPVCAGNKTNDAIKPERALGAPLRWSCCTCIGQVFKCHALQFHLRRFGFPDSDVAVGAFYLCTLLFLRKIYICFPTTSTPLPLAGCFSFVRSRTTRAKHWKISVQAPQAVFEKYARHYQPGNHFQGGRRYDGNLLCLPRRIGVYRGIEEAQQMIGVVETGGVFGEMAYLLNEKRMATAISTTESTILIISTGIFEELLQVNQPFAGILSSSWAIVSAKSTCRKNRECKNILSDFWF